MIKFEQRAKCLGDAVKDYITKNPTGSSTDDYLETNEGEAKHKKLIPKDHKNFDRIFL